MKKKKSWVFMDLDIMLIAYYDTDEEMEGLEKLKSMNCCNIGKDFLTTTW